MTFETLDAETPLAETLATNPAFLRGVSGKLSTRIALADGMFKAREPMNYLRVGRDAIDSINHALAHRVVAPEKIGSILDFGGGYGRVTRWLIAAFPDAKVQTADADTKAMACAAELFGIPAHTVDKAAPKPIGKFDLIWVGSLFTHLPREAATSTMNFLANQLTPNGLLVFTTHGRFVANRVRRREKTYHLDEAGCVELLNGHANGGFGFAAYPGQEGYGIAITENRVVLGLCEGAGLEAIAFTGRGWRKHQDVWAAQKLANPAGERNSAP